MKTLLIAINSRYIHSSLAPWYLKASCGDSFGEIKVVEYTINDNTDSVLRRIYEEKCDVAAFSCYIWNFDEVLRVADNLKKISPKVRIVFGGPEVSYDPLEILNSCKSVDFILSGEGEESFRLLLKSFLDPDVELKDICGLSYRKNGQATGNTSLSLIKDLNSIPSPYTEGMLKSSKGKILYYESSRGCPFSCSYCISSTYSGVRYFSIDRVKEELLRIINAGAALVKFVDRTFNCNKARAKEILRFIVENSRETRFHFEAAADLFDEEMLEILANAPRGLIQLEIGIQSTNTLTLEAVNRKTNLEKVFYYVNKITGQKNIHVHLDLIAGLPHEDFNSFKKSFNDVYKLSPHKLQLGFLKLLKGSGIRKDSEKYGYEFREYRPYEVLSNSCISFDEIMMLKGIEDLAERYCNSGRFKLSLRFIIDTCFESPFEFYECLYNYFLESGLIERAISSRELYSILLDFIERRQLEVKPELFKELLKFDFLISDNTNNLPSGLGSNSSKSFREECFAFLKDEENIKLHLPQFTGQPAKKIINKVHFERFLYDLTGENGFERKDTVYLFNYAVKDEVSGHYEYRKIY